MFPNIVNKFFVSSHEEITNICHCCGRPLSTVDRLIFPFQVVYVKLTLEDDSKRMGVFMACEDCLGNLPDLHTDHITWYLSSPNGYALPITSWEPEPKNIFQHLSVKEKSNVYSIQEWPVHTTDISGLIRSKWTCPVCGRSYKGRGRCEVQYVLVRTDDGKLRIGNTSACDDCGKHPARFTSLSSKKWFCHDPEECFPMVPRWKDSISIIHWENGAIYNTKLVHHWLNVVEVTHIGKSLTKRYLDKLNRG